MRTVRLAARGNGALKMDEDSAMPVIGEMGNRAMPAHHAAFMTDREQWWAQRAHDRFPFKKGCSSFYVLNKG